MIMPVSQRLLKAYAANKKNVNYSLDFLLSSIDPQACPASLILVEEFKLLGDAGEIEIDAHNIETIKQIFGAAEPDIVERLLWVALMFPEI